MSLTKRAPNSCGLGFESHNKNDIQTGNRKIMVLGHETFALFVIYIY